MYFIHTFLFFCSDSSDPEADDSHDQPPRDPVSSIQRRAPHFPLEQGRQPEEHSTELRWLGVCRGTRSWMLPSVPTRAEDDWLNVSSSSCYCSLLSCLVQVEKQLLFKEILKSEQKYRVFSDCLCFLLSDGGYISVWVSRRRGGQRQSRSRQRKLQPPKQAFVPILRPLAWKSPQTDSDPARLQLPPHWDGSQGRGPQSLESHPGELRGQKRDLVRGHF